MVILTESAKLNKTRAHVQRQSDSDVLGVEIIDATGPDIYKPESSMKCKQTQSARNPAPVRLEK